jgi:hypothetical protein
MKKNALTNEPNKEDLDEVRDSIEKATSSLIFWKLDATVIISLVVALMIGLYKLLF